jgi:hypothetical protein
MFADWCRLRGVPSLPAPPSVVAAFVADVAALGPERVFAALQEVSRSHSELDYSDPTRAPTVSREMNAISGIEPPRSWPKEHHHRFYELPWDLQRYVLEREKDRDRAVTRAMNAAAAARQGKNDGKDVRATA